MRDLRKSLLYTLNTTQVNSLLTEVNLEKQGYSFKYIIDLHDIIAYCFPFGLNLSNTEFNTFLVADRQNAYHYLFQNHDIVILDEYVNELSELLRSRIRRYFDQVKSIKQEIASYLMVFNNQDKKDNTKIEDFLKRNMSLICATALGINQPPIDKFRKVFTEILISEQDTVATNYSFEEDENIIWSSLKIFFEYIDEKSKAALSNIRLNDNLKKIGIENEKYSAYYDNIALLKCIELNKNALLNNKKELYLFISSVERTSFVFSRISDYLPVINGQPFLFHRIDAQVFAKLVFKRFYDSNYQHYTDRLSLLKSSLSYPYLRSSKQLIELNSDLEDTKNRLENYGLILNFKEIKSEFQKAVKLSTNKDLNKVKGLLKSANNYLNSQNTNIEIIDDYLYKVNRKINIINIVKNIDFVNNRNFGLDPIESVKQQLPLVFDFDNLNRVNTIKHIVQDICYYFSLPQLNRKEEDKFKSNFVSRLKSLKEGSFERLFIESLAYLIVPVNKEAPQTRPNEIVFKQISFLLNRRSLLQETALKYSEEALRELKYIQVWAARRSQKYSKGLTLSESYLKEYPEDPRFYHSKALIIYSNLEDFGNSKQAKYYNKSEVSIEVAIESAEIALNLYKEFKRRGVERAELAIEALYNSLSHFYTLKAIKYIDSNTELFRLSLESARFNIKKLKSYLYLNGLFIKNIPEYISTEAYLEYYEYLLFKHKGVPTEQLLKKLSYAKEAVSESIKGSKDCNHKTLKKKENLLSQINSAIRTEKNLLYNR